MEQGPDPDGFLFLLDKQRSRIAANGAISDERFVDILLQDITKDYDYATPVIQMQSIMRRIEIDGLSVQDSPQSSDSYMSVRSMVYWAIRLQSVLGSVCVMSRVGFPSVSLVLLISCLHALAGVRQPIIHEL